MMKNFVFFCAVFFCAAAICAQENAKIDVREISMRRGKELISILNENKIEYEERRLQREYGAWGTSVFVRPAKGDGTDGTNEERAVVVAIPISSPNDDGEGTHTGFETAIKLLTNKNTPQIFYAFLADEWDTQADAGMEAAQSNAGLRDLLDELGYLENYAILYYNVIKAPGSLEIVQAAPNNVTPLNILEAWTDACETENIPFRLLTRFNTLYKNEFAPSPPPPRIAGEYSGENAIPLLYVQPDSASAQDANNAIYKENAVRAISEWALRCKESFANEFVYEPVINYYIAGLDFLPIYISEIGIIFVSLFFALLLFFFVLFIRYARGRTKIYFIIMGVFITLFYFVMIFIDITLVPLTMPSLCVLSILFVLQAINKKYHIIKKYFKAISAATIFICVVIAVIPFVNILSDLFRLGAQRSMWRPFEVSSNFARDERSERGLDGASNLLNAAFSETLSKSTVLDRRIITLDIKSKESAFLYNVIFKPEQTNIDYLNIGGQRMPVFVYAAPVPWAARDNEIIFLMGAFPPKEVYLEIVLPTGLTGEFVVEGFWQDSAERYTLNID